MRVLVTGGTGFIGSHLVLALLREGHEVLITGNDSEQEIPGFTGRILYPSFIALNLDAIGHVDVVFHQAAINNTLLQDKEEFFRANVESARVLFEYVIAHGCQRIVYASSTAVYGNGHVPYREDQPLQPLNAYAASKVQLEQVASTLADQHPTVTMVGLRYCNVYGPGEGHKGKRSSMITQLAQQVIVGNPRLFRAGEQKRDYIFVDDAVRANLLAAKARESCIVNCGAGTATTFNRLVEILNETLGTDRTPEYFDNQHPEAYQSHTECDMTQARARIGFAPEVAIDEGIRRTVASGLLVHRGHVGHDTE